MHVIILRGANMKEMDYVIWQEGQYFVAQCLNVDVSSFGETLDEASINLKEAVELYLQDEDISLPVIGKVLLGREMVNA